MHRQQQAGSGVESVLCSKLRHTYYGPSCGENLKLLYTRSYRKRLQYLNFDDEQCICSKYIPMYSQNGARGSGLRVRTDSDTKMQDGKTYQDTSKGM